MIVGLFPDPAPVNVRISRKEFFSSGTVERSDTLKRGTAYLEVGDEFSLGTVVDMATVSVPFGSKHKHSRFGSFGGEMAIGWGKISTLGIKGVNPIGGSNKEFEYGLVESTSSDSGVAIEGWLEWLAGKESGDKFFLKYPVVQYIHTGSNGLEYTKISSEIGFAALASNNVRILGGIDAGTWRITSAQRDGFDSAQSVNGFAVRFGLEYYW
jgi:hypothetical protein